MNLTSTTRPRLLLRPVIPLAARLLLRPVSVRFQLSSRQGVRLGTLVTIAFALIAMLVVLSSWIPYPAIIGGLMTLLIFGVCLAAFVLDDPASKQP